MINLKRIYILFLASIFCVAATIIGTSADNGAAMVISTELMRNNYPTIIIDAGHGGEDGGATSLLGDLEKDINLDICLTLEMLLIQGGYNTKSIRKTDISIHDNDAATVRERKVTDIHNRVKLANDSKDNILVSIHQNHFSESKYFGTQVFYSKNNANSQILAENIRTAVTSLLQPENTRKCKESAGVYLLDNTSVPAIIVECGFLSNPDEAYLLSQQDYRDSIAYSIYLGIVEYIYLNY